MTIYSLRDEGMLRRSEAEAAVDEAVSKGYLEPAIVDGAPGYALTDLGRSRLAAKRGEIQ